MSIKKIKVTAEPPATKLDSTTTPTNMVMMDTTPAPTYPSTLSTSRIDRPPTAEAAHDPDHHRRAKPPARPHFLRSPAGPCTVPPVTITRGGLFPLRPDL